MKKIDVIRYFGGVGSTASMLGITHVAVSRWPPLIPEKRAMQLERLTKDNLKYDSRLYKKRSIA
ncbi:Cro/CI family transcriptional regulator [Candidatus Symbiopectobacterium sp.]|uniref:Cro/CI family transcriptional regulator n=1 Tax=Candidatus Symbiopectobacterium sp. TaxID=2816440 RepID=UPI0025C04882|nr:Cro/CI family transcriptional regulator [Candidatus Symbiopectobacterium sp.]